MHEDTSLFTFSTKSPISSITFEACVSSWMLQFIVNQGGFMIALNTYSVALNIYSEVFEEF